MKTTHFRPASLVFVLLITLVSVGGFQSLVAQSSETPPSIDEKIVPRDWLTVGPFSAGAGESGLNPLREHGSFRDIQPREGMTHSSILAENGEVQWRRRRANRKGKLPLKSPNVSWDRIRARKGYSMFISSFYASTTVEVDGPRRALVVAEEVNTFRVNDRLYSGGFYGHGYVRVPVLLEDGRNRIMISAGGYSNQTVQFQLLPVDEIIKPIKKDVTRPDLVRNRKLTDRPIGIPIANTTGSWLRDLEITVQYARDGSANGEQVAGETTISDLGPLAFRKPSVRLNMENLQWSKIGDQDTLPVTVEVRSKNTTVSFKTELDIRDPGEPFRVTYRSRSDGSTQYYAVQPPKNYKPDRDYAVILSLHGAGVKAYEFQMPAYTKKSWAFVVAPTGRRRFGFSWEHTGRLNAMQSLDHALDTFSIDPNRVYLSGHSMGGHGAWVVGTLHTDRFAALAPSAAWTSVDFYTPKYNRKDRLYGNPRAIAVHRAALRPSRPQAFLENLLHVPAFIIQGGKDKVVPPYHARLVRQRLKQLGYEVEYREVSEHGDNNHFWDKKETPGTDAVDMKELMQYLRPKKRDPNPEEVVFRSGSLAESHSAYWVGVLQRKDPLQDCRVRASVENGNTISLSVSNVRFLEIDTGNAPVNSRRDRVTIEAVDSRIKANTGETVSLRVTEDGIEKGSVDSGKRRKTPAQSGPMRQVYYQPFVLVYATEGSREWRDVTYGQARKFAQYWWRKGNGSVRIVPDHKVTDAMMAKRNLVLFGNARTNSILKKINEELPIQFLRIGVRIGSERKRGEDLAVRMVHPNPEAPERLVLVNGGVSLDAQKNVPGATGYPDEWPDYIVRDSTWEQTGMTDAVAVGYFDYRWEIDRRFGYFRD